MSPPPAARRTHGQSEKSGRPHACRRDTNDYLSVPTLTSCILWGNKPSQLEGGTPQVIYSNVAGGWPGEGNIDADPRYCDTSCGELRNLGLAADSPCLGAGQHGADMGAWGESCEVPVEVIPTVFRVPDDYPTIGEALALACDRDTITIAPGIYNESDLEIPSVGMVLTSLDPLDPAIVAATVIDGREEDVIRFHGTYPFEPAILSGLTVTGGGTGVTCIGASPSIELCRFEDNHSISPGGGLLCMGSSPKLRGCEVKGNVVLGPLSGGAGLYCYRSSPALTNCTIRENAVFGLGGPGAGIWCRTYSSPELSNCVIARNTVWGAAGEGGGAYSVYYSYPSFTNWTREPDRSWRA